MYIYPDKNNSDSLQEQLEGALNKTVTDKVTIMLENENRMKAVPLSVIIKNYSRSVVMEHSLFACLSDPNIYLYRFLGVFPEDLTLFEFFGREQGENRKLLSDTRSAFEDSVFSYFLGQPKHAYNGFSNVLKINPNDLAASSYKFRCEKLL